MTLTEVAIVIVALLVLGTLLLYSMVLQRGRSRHGPGYAPSRCANNLKQIGLSYKVFANDNDDKFPFHVSNSLAFGNVTQAWMHFQAMSNECGSAKILMCRSDRDRYNNLMADFGMGPNVTALSLSTKSNAAVSYTASLDAEESLPNVILSSHRYLVTNSLNLDGRLFLANSNMTRIGWTKDYHDGAGDVVLADGSVHQVSSSALARLVQQQGVATNRLLLPFLP